MEFTKVLLSTVELNQDNIKKEEITILNREVLEDIISKLDLDALAYKAYNKALGYSFGGKVDVEIDARDGEILISWTQNNNISIGYYNTYINLFSIDTGNNESIIPENEIYWFTEDEHISYFESLENRNTRIKNGKEDGEILNEDEIRDFVIEKFNLDLDELKEEYFKIAAAEMVDCLYNIDSITEQLNELYSNVVNCSQHVS